MSKDTDLERVKAAAESLSEHFDTVMIFTTRHESGELQGTVNVAWGVGNWFARRGQVAEWMIKETEQTRIDVRNEDQ